MFYLQGISGYLLYAVIAVISFLIVYEVVLRIKREYVSWFHRWIILLMAIYLTIVLTYTISPDYFFIDLGLKGNINLIPFRVLTDISKNPLNFWGNIAMFIPLGALLVMLSSQCQKLRTTLLLGAALSLFIEIMQLFSYRSTDIDDVILNTCGALIGFLLGKIILYFIPSLRKKIGVFRKGRHNNHRKYNDAAGIIVLTAFVITSMFISEFAETNAEIQSQIVPGDEDLYILNQAADADEAKIYADIYAKNALLCSMDSATVLYEKDSREKIAPASTAKLLTALTAMDYCDLDEDVEVGQEVEMIGENASRAWLYPGYHLTVRQLLDALLLPSGNDAAYALAVYTGRSIAKDANISIGEALTVFIEAMNKKAVAIGALDSNFINPDGYDTEGQYTTAYDLTCIARAFYQKSILREIASTYRISDVWLSGQDVTYYNTNELINPESSYYYPNACGLKTGTSEAAGGCLISAAVIDGESYLCIVMGSTDEGRWTDSLTLYQAISQ